jgi:5'(3')-deoxyribonucleotidase
MKKLLIALDADGVLRNFTAGALTIIKEVTGKTFAPADVTAFNFSKALGLTEDEKRAVMTAISTRRGFVTALPSYPEARQGVRRLRDLGDVFCVTSPWESPWGDNPWWRAESEAWLALHFGIDNVQHAHDKESYEADVFVDDRAKNVRAWSAAWPGRVAVLWRTPHNSSESVPVGAHSIGSWDALYLIAREAAKGPVQLTLPTEEALA